MIGFMPEQEEMMSSMLALTAQDYQDCLTQPSKIVETKLGPVEYAERGEGPVVLSVHGGPGGYDQGLALGECFRKNGFKIVAPSRPGYLGTPLGKGTTPQGQADVLAALLDALEMEKVLVVGASAGGPSSYTLAQNYPEKVRALMEIDSVSIKYTKGEELNKGEELLYLSKPGMWMMDWFMRHFPEAVVKSFLKTESTLEGHELGDRVKSVITDPVKFAFLDVMTKTMTHKYDERKEGTHNDLSFLAAIDKLPLDKISCPSLIFQGDADSDVPPSHGEYAHQAIQGSELYWIDKGSHVGFWISDVAQEAMDYAVQWFKKQPA